MSRYIDADAFIKKMQSVLDKNADKCYEDKVSREAFEIIVNGLKNATTADVEEVRHGEWLHQPYMTDMYSEYYICSVCRRLEQVSHAYDIKTFSPYCHCGARMDGGGKE